MEDLAFEELVRSTVEFRGLVRRMRALQREFFRTRAEDRPPDLIRRAKALEREVDRALEGDVQGELF